MEIQDMLDSLKAQAEEKLKMLHLPIPNKPDNLENIQLPPELATVQDDVLDGLFDKFALVCQYVHYCEELTQAQLEMAQYNYDLEWNIKLSGATERRRDLMTARIITDDENLKRWLEVISTLKVQVRLISGLSKGYSTAIKRIQSEKIDRASRRKHGIL